MEELEKEVQEEQDKDFFEKLDNAVKNQVEELKKDIVILKSELNKKLEDVINNYLNLKPETKEVTKEQEIIDENDKRYLI